ncbi:MAG: SH3 domain-containing protein [Peptococcia bacterium]
MRIRTIIIGGAIISIIAGFALSKTVVANSPTPGSSEDPVVSKSYVDQAVQDRVQELEKKVAELTVQSQALQSTINDLQAKINKGTTTKPSTGTTKPSTGTTNPGTTNPGTSNPNPTQGDSVIGKKAYVKEGNSYGTVNLRESTSTNSPIVKKVGKGEAMTILEVKKVGNDTWYRITLDDGTTAYVASWVVDVK